MTVRETAAAIVRHPARFLRARWNWKAALLSGVMRGAIFFGAALDFGLPAAARALMVDAAFRVPVAGACAAVIQEVRWAEPRWAAIAVAVVGVPAGAHAIEIAAHSMAGTPVWWRAVAVSCGLSVVSSAVEWLLMRHGVLLVGPGSGSLGGDLRRLFRLAVPRAS